jgi:CRP-like cAMP-binding protein
MPVAADLVVSTALRDQLIRIGKPLAKPKGSTLFSRGDEVTGLFLIRSGQVSLELEKGHPAFPARTLSAGSVVGLPAAVGGAPYSLSARVVEDSELVFVSRDAVTECLKKNPTLCFEVMDILSREISSTRTAIKSKSIRSPKE